MDATMNFYTQDTWTWWFAIYLYFGGLGAATVAVTFLTDMYLKRHPSLVLWGAWTGVGLLSLGSALLFLHLLDHMAVVHVMNPMAVVRNPNALIAWGTQFITWMMVWAVVYAMPDMRESAFWRKLPVVKNVLDWKIYVVVADFIRRNRKIVGWLATVNAVGIAVYTGLLLQQFPAVALWHNPAVPLLFTVSAFSTAMALLLVLMYLVIHEKEDDHIRVLYERVDLVLISVELVIIFSFFQYLRGGSESAVKSFEILWNDMGWIFGFIVFGLIVPFLLELKGVIKGWVSHVPIVTASILVLVGGYLLRHYFMYAGVYAHPW